MLQTKKITIDKDITLSYVEENELFDETIFFIHGNSGSSNTWRKQLSSEILSTYRLVAFDLPGHGASPALENPEGYNVIYLAKLIAAAIRKLSKGVYYIIGLSLGTNICAEMISFDISPKA